MGAPTVYKHSDTSAPTLDGLAGSLNTLLHACLVTGYGSKSSLGWTREYVSGNVSVYRPAAGLRRYLRVVDSDGQRARIIGYRTMSDANTGVDPFPLPYQVLDQNVANSRMNEDGLYARKSLTASSLAREWTLIGNDHSFYMILGANKSLAAGTRNADGHIGFGILSRRFNPLDQQHAWIMGMEYSNSTQEFSGFAYTQALVYVGRSTFGGGIHFEGQALSGVAPHSAGRIIAGMDIASTYPHPAAGGLAMNRITALTREGFTPRGLFPGWWLAEHAFSSFTHMDTFSGKTGSTLDSRSFLLVRTGSESPVSGVIFETTAGSWDG